MREQLNQVRYTYSTTQTTTTTTTQPTQPQYRVVQVVSGAYYAQTLHRTTTTKGYLLWRKTIEDFKWVSLSPIGTIPQEGAMYQHKNNIAKMFTTLCDATRFMNRVKQGVIVYGSC